MSQVIALHGGEDIGRSGDPTKNTATYKFLAVGYDNSFAAMLAIQAYIAPAVVVGSSVIYPWDIDLKHVEADNYEATVHYVTPEQQEQPSQQPPPNFPELSMEIATENTHVTQGLEVRQAFPSGASKDRFNGQINVEIDSKGHVKVKGVDVPVSKLTLNVDFNTPPPASPFAMGRTLANLAPGVNSTTWYGFQPGELRYMGASVRGKLGDLWKMRYVMDASPNVTIPVDFGTPSAPAVTQCPKRGWDYFWIHYATRVVETADGQAVQPRAVYAFTHKMFQEYDFRIFGLGG